MKTTKKYLLALASLTTCLGAANAWGLDYNLEACKQIASAQSRYACQQTNSKDTSSCKNAMISASSANTTSQCWSAIGKWYTIQNSKLNTCMRKAVQLYAESGGNRNTNSPVYKSLMLAYKDTNSDGGTCEVNYSNAWQAWSREQTASKASSSGASKPKMPLTDCSDSKKIQPAAKPMCEKDMAKRTECNKTNDPSACYNKK